MSGSNPNIAQTTGAEVKVLLKTNIGHRNIVWWLAEGERVCACVFNLAGSAFAYSETILREHKGKKVKNERIGKK